jgi:transposase
VNRVDARKLAELRYTKMLRPVYHRENCMRALKELARSYVTISKDQARVMTRVKALYRSWGIACSVRHRASWLGKIKEPGVRRRAEFYYQQLDGLRSVRRQVRREFLVESGKHKASKLLRQIPSFGPIRAALLLALVQTPHRFRTKRQLWTYSGFGHASENGDPAALGRFLPCTTLLPPLRVLITVTFSTPTRLDSSTRGSEIATAPQQTDVFAAEDHSPQRAHATVSFRN